MGWAHWLVLIVGFSTTSLLALLNVRYWQFWFNRCACLACTAVAAFDLLIAYVALTGGA